MMSHPLPPTPDCVLLTRVNLQTHVSAKKCGANSANSSWLCATAASLTQRALFLTQAYTQSITESP